MLVHCKPGKTSNSVIASFLLVSQRMRLYAELQQQSDQEILKMSSPLPRPPNTAVMRRVGYGHCWLHLTSETPGYVDFIFLVSWKSLALFPCCFQPVCRRPGICCCGQRRCTHAHRGRVCSVGLRVHAIDPQLCACRLSLLSRAPLLDRRHPAGTLKGWPRARCCHESSLDLERETKRKGKREELCRRRGLVKQKDCGMKRKNRLSNKTKKIMEKLLENRERERRRQHGSADGEF